MEKKSAPTASVMGTGPLNQLMFTLGIPAVVAQLINILYNIVDRMFIGHLPDIGPTALTGLGVTAPIILVVSAFAALVGGGGAPLSAIALGEKNEARAEKILSTSLFLLIILSLILTSLFMLFQEPLLMLFGASKETYPYASQYLQIYLMGTIFVQLALGLNPFISAQGKAKTAMYTVAIGAVVNIVLDYTFIYRLNLGVMGAALATIIAQFVSACFVTGYLISARSQIRLKLPKPSALAKPILALGSSTFVMQATEAAIVVVFNASLLKYGGNLHVGTMTILQSLMMFMVMPPVAFTTGVQPLISYNYGARNFVRVKETVKRMLIVATSYTFLMGALLTLFPRQAASIFTTNAELLDLTAQMLPIFLAGLWLFGLQLTAQSFFVGTNKPKIALFVATLRKVILIIPLVLILSAKLGTFGVYLAECISDAISVTTATTILFFVIRSMNTSETNRPT